MPRLWSELAYAGEKRVPQPIDSTAGSWPTFFLKRDQFGDFLDPDGCPIAFDIRHPDTIDFEGEELENVRQIGRIIVNKLKNQRDSDMVRIDIPELEDRQADLPPPPYRQVIPFLRGRECSSLLDPREDPPAR
ncbi:hypothetical protein [Bacillus swezeyi]|uniref:hypothetical protein n=1 Tax=Bacillus swezeyi TaxID=1925020 RepID=UPI0012386052|nr:hypothetical protein [Bacillus swezeyi]